MFDLSALSQALETHDAIVRVVVAEVKGSVPREIGAAMLVWDSGQSGTIGGGTLEFEATKAARQMLSDGASTRQSVHPLGPQLGQCCGGSVTLVSERFEERDVKALSASAFYVRRVAGDTDMPLMVERAKARARGQGTPVDTMLADGWFIEPLASNATPLWIWGAGHVGRAIVHTLGPLGQFDITWIDTAANRYPEDISEGVTQLIAENPADLVSYAPQEAQHLILTYSHALDLELCHCLLHHSAAFTGLIGSKTKWARFQSRLRSLGHGQDSIQRITCPIGEPALGKQPQAIAIGVASQLMKLSTRHAQQEGSDNVQEFAVHH